MTAINTPPTTIVSAHGEASTGIHPSKRPPQPYKVRPRKPVHVFHHVAATSGSAAVPALLLAPPNPKGTNSALRSKNPQTPGVGIQPPAINRARVVPKDGDVIPRALVMNLRIDADMESLRKEAFIHGSGPTMVSIRAMADFVSSHGLDLVVTVPSSAWEQLETSLRELGLEGVRWVQIPDYENEWAQDTGDFVIEGNECFVQIPAPCPIPKAEIEETLRRACLLSRIRSYHTDVAEFEHLTNTELEKRFPQLAFPSSMRTALYGSIDKETLAAELGLSLHHASTHVEGGNMLSGRHADGRTFVIVGRDSVAISQAMWQYNGFSIDATEDDVAAAIQADYGVDELYVVDQPGDFHLDVCMTVLNPGEVLINDSRAACEQEIAWMWENYQAREPRRKGRKKPNAKQMRAWEAEGDELRAHAADLRDRAAEQIAHEDRVAVHLEEAGLSVVRLPWRMHSNWGHTNFFNGVAMTLPELGRVFITQGGSPWAEARAVQDLAKLGIDHVYFLDPQASNASLQKEGGLACRTKIIPKWV